MTLAEVEVGAHVALRQVGDKDAERLRYLKSIGLVPVVELVVLDKAPFGGPITVRVGQRDTKDRVIGPELASGLMVERR